MDWKKEHPTYDYGTLDENTVATSPWNLWESWQQEAKKIMQYTNEIVLATADGNASPSARMVLLKYASPEQGFCFYSNRKSKKGLAIQQNPKAQILWYCSQMHRQLRVYGTISELCFENVRTYAQSRPRESQISAYISKQSTPVPSKQVILDLYEKAERELEGKNIPVPTDWTGYSLSPKIFEFWQGKSNRLHDRIVYTAKNEEDAWTISRLFP